MEKKLGIKSKKKLPQAFKDDGLDELLEGLEEILRKFRDLAIQIKLLETGSQRNARKQPRFGMEGEEAEKRKGSAAKMNM